MSDCSERVGISSQPFSGLYSSQSSPRIQGCPTDVSEDVCRTSYEYFVPIRIAVLLPANERKCFMSSSVTLAEAQLELTLLDRWRLTKVKCS